MRNANEKTQSFGTTLNFSTIAAWVMLLGSLIVLVLYYITTMEISVRIYAGKNIYDGFSIQFISGAHRGTMVRTDTARYDGNLSSPER